MITRKLASGKLFLRNSDEEGTYDYSLEFQKVAANLSIWSLTIPGTQSSPEMTFTTIDGQDFTEISAHKRNVTVTMAVGPKSQPIWQGAIAYGYHSK